MTIPQPTTEIHDLGDGLILRWSTPADIEKIGTLLGTAFRDSADAPLNVRMADQARLSVRPDYPFRGATAWGIVEDTSKPECPVIACTCLWRHQWSYAGIPLAVGRPEFVASDPTYRNRGLVRKVFKLLHDHSAAEGHLLQAITGIPYFYRQFGYEYALDLGGSRTTYLSLIPDKKGEEPEPYALRRATMDDIPHLIALYNQGRKSSLVWHEVSEAYWRYLIGYWDEPANQNGDIATLGMSLYAQMIIDGTGKVCGYMVLGARRGGRGLYVGDLALYPQISLPAAMPVLLRLLREYGVNLPIVKPDTPPLSEIVFNFGRAHPVYAVLGQNLAPHVETPYAWYIRIPDIPAFIQRIMPVLEERLANSPLAAYDGELKVDFYRGGLRLVFVQLLVGYRSLTELRAIYPDVDAKNEAAQLINILFPALPSAVNAL